MPKCNHCAAQLHDSDVSCPECGRLVPDSKSYSANSSPGKKKTKPGQLVSRRSSHFKSKLFLAALVLFLVLPQTAPNRERIMEYPDDPSKLTEDITSLWDDLNPKYFKVDAKANFKIKRVLKVTAKSGDIDFSLRVGIPENVTAEDGTKIQTIREWKWESSSNNVNREKSLPWVFFNGSAANGETVYVNLTYDVAVKTYQWEDITSGNSGTVDQIPENLKEQYNHDETTNDGTRPLINLDDVRSRAENVTSGDDNVYDKVRTIYDYVRANVQYQVGTKPKTCRETLSGGVGDCDDMVLLFSAMCRSVGIPAYPGYGYISNRNYVGWGGHSWANVVIPDKNGNIYKPHIDLPNEKFLWYDTYRLIEWNDDGNQEHLSDYYNTFSSHGSGKTDFSQEFIHIAHHSEGEKLIKAD